MDLAKIHDSYTTSRGTITRKGILSVISVFGGPASLDVLKSANRVVTSKSPIRNPERKALLHPIKLMSKSPHHGAWRPQASVGDDLGIASQEVDVPPDQVV